MAMPGGIGLVETPEDAVGTPVAPGRSSYGPTPPRRGAHTREKRTTPRNFFLRAASARAQIISAGLKLITSIAGLRMKFELGEVRFYSQQKKIPGLRFPAVTPTQTDAQFCFCFASNIHMLHPWVLKASRSSMGVLTG